MNILEHEFVPKHEIIPNEEAQKVLEEYRITQDLLPRIYDTDPVAKIIGAKPGNFVKITRKSLTAGESIIYRLCVKGEE
ncbi:MAG: DNA-directed RNA polymerase subunit H [Candidatus Helarchaeota archaeon]|nr:DNA-directed RNA polymerase subunit H [Candidatus Helarchaeota archaeon]